jgi:hypothetical protein
MVKIIWVLIGINISALFIFIVLYFVNSVGRNVDTMEKGWTAILAILGAVVILLAVLPLKFGHSSFSLYMSAFFAALPLSITLCIVISKNLPSFKKKQTMAELYYKDKTQRSIATAIEQGDTTLLKELIKGQDLNVQGNKVWDWPGLNYLQFAVRLRSNPGNFPFNDTTNTAAIRLLIENGSATTPALAEAIKYVPYETVTLLLDAGADPNTQGYASPDPLLFEAIGTKKQENNIAILLLKKGADPNAKSKNYDQMTPAMFASNNARTSAQWNDVWRVVRYMLEQAHCDYAYVTKDGLSLGGIIRTIRENALKEQKTMAPDFLAVVAWLKEHHIDTEPVNTSL